jgi:uncharacterized surface protein with fasciclin (FAS1) repeats
MSNVLTGKTYSNSWLVLMLMLVMAAGCTKDDIMPEPIGDKIPYTAPGTKTWQAIAQDAPYTLWNAAWKRSHLAEWVIRSGTAYQTVFLPTDQAFANAGWTLATINAADIADLDSLLAYHIVEGFYKPENINGIKGSLQLKTLLKSETVKGYRPDKPYTFKLYAGYYADSLMIDGKAVNKIDKGFEAINGYVFPVASLLARPKMSIWEYLESEPRFSLFVAAMHISNEIYLADYISIDHEAFLRGDYGPLVMATLFAPTNNAFIKHGFNTPDDIRAYVEKSLPIPYPDYDENWFYQQPVTAIDSLLFPHGLEGYRFSAGSGFPVDVSFFTNDITDNGNAISGMLIKPGQMYNSPPAVLNLSFSSSSGMPMVKRLNSTKEATPLLDTNIKLYNGVVHVVDDLLMP